MNEKILGCTNCPKRFETLRDLNAHISMTKHHSGRKFSKVEIAKKIGLVRFVVSIPS